MAGIEQRHAEVGVGPRLGVVHRQRPPDQVDGGAMIAVLARDHAQQV